MSEFEAKRKDLEGAGLMIQRQVPTIQRVQKTVEVPKMQFIDKVIDDPRLCKARCPPFKVHSSTRTSPRPQTDLDMRTRGEGSSARMATKRRTKRGRTGDDWKSRSRGGVSTRCGRD